MVLTANRRRFESSAQFDALTFRESFPAVASSVPTARQAICDFALSVGMHEDQLELVRLACSEALTNVVQYAYPWRVGHIHVTARLADDELWVLIADSGCGIHAGGDSEGLGLGLALISSLTDGFSVIGRSSGGTELRLRFTLQSMSGTESPARAAGYDLGSRVSAIRPASSRFSTTT